MRKLLTKASKGRFYDIAANLADGMFQGHYHGKQAHPCDLEHVLKRATDVGVDR